MKRIIYILTIFVFAFSCNKHYDEKSTTISNLSFSGCQTSQKSTESDSTCITIKSNNENNLTFTLKGAEFCCGSEKIDVSLIIKGDSIIINEIDKGPFTYCFCKHEISFIIGPLDYSNYKVKIIESENSYKRDTLVFEFNHTEATNFTNCK